MEHKSLRLIYGRTLLVAVSLLLQLFVIFAVFFWFSDNLAYAYGAVYALSTAYVVYLVNTSASAETRLSWILLTIAAPVVGLALYFLKKTDIGYRKVHGRLNELMEETAPYMEKAPAEHTRATYYPIGETAWQAILEALESAKRFIFLEYFIIDDGEMWGSILEVLDRKAREGVEVRVLYDGTCALFRLPYRYPKALQARGIKCKMFSPIRPILTTVYNNRDHRKILVVDGETVFTGGINLADEYINRKTLYGHWKDVAIRLEGDAVRRFTLMFLQMWDIDETAEDYEKYLIPSAVAGEGRVIPYGDSPLDDVRVGKGIYQEMLYRAERYAYIMTPYLILDESMLDALTFAARRGVDVAIILPHIPDKKYAFALAHTHYRQLLDAGVRILEYTPGFVHAKLMVSDDRAAVVGTSNLDYRSLYLHFECGVALYDMPVIRDIKADFESTEKQCMAYTTEMLRHDKWTLRLTGWLLKVFAPLM